MKKTQWIVFVAVALFVMACASNQPISKVAPMPNAPEWVTKGEAAFPDAKDKLYAVGLASNIPDKSLAVETADNRARGQLAQRLQTLVKKMTQDYRSSVTARNASTGKPQADFEQLVKNVQETLTEQRIVGVTPVDHYYEPDGTVYALVELDMKSFQKMVDMLTTINGVERQHIMENASKAFDEMNQKLDAARAQ